jgi:hypothetical protein
VVPRCVCVRESLRESLLGTCHNGGSRASPAHGLLITIRSALLTLRECVVYWYSTFSIYMARAWRRLYLDSHERLAGWYRWAGSLPPGDTRPGCVARMGGSSQFCREAHLHRANKMKGLEPIPPCAYIFFYTDSGGLANPVFA